MPGWQLVSGLVGHHIIPAVLSSAVVWGVLWLIFGPLQLRAPADRVLFLYAGTLKAALLLCAGVGVSCLAASPRVYGLFWLRLPDVVPDHSILEPQTLAVPLARSNLAAWAIIVGILASLLLLARRWARLAPVYRRLYEADAARGWQFPELFQAFEELVGKARWLNARLPRPRLLIVRNAPAAACAVGVRCPAVVLSWELAQRLGPRELRGIVAHELGHVRRLDYLGRWFAIILRDIMIWNPAVVAWYERLEHEQERAADEFGAHLVQDPGAVAAGLVEVAANLQRLPFAFFGPLAVARKRQTRQLLDDRLQALEQMQDDQARPRAMRRCWLALALLAFLLVQPQVAVSLPNLLALARRLL